MKSTNKVTFYLNGVDRNKWRLANCILIFIFLQQQLILAKKTDYTQLKNYKNLHIRLKRQVLFGGK